MSGTVDDVLRIAAAEVGYCRWDDPLPGTKYGRWYADMSGSPYFGESGVPYCAMYVSWVLDQAGVQCEGFPSAVAIDRRNGFNRAVEPIDCMAGDVIGFDWDSDLSGDHVGIVESHTGGYVTINTFEGNTDNGCVRRKTRKVSDCTIGVRPYYDGSQSPAKAAGLLDVDGVAGPNTVRALQAAMGTVPDGVISGQLESEDRWRRNVWAVDHDSDGSGSDVVAALQAKLKARGSYRGSMDRCWGYCMTEALQIELRDMGYYTGAIDHDFGHHSVESLQRSLNDGRW